MIRIKTTKNGTELIISGSAKVIEAIQETLLQEVKNGNITMPRHFLDNGNWEDRIFKDDKS